MGWGFHPICLGSADRGLIGESDSDYDAAQLVYWSCSTASVWKLSAPHSLFDEGPKYDAIASYQLYQLRVDMSSGSYAREDFWVRKRVLVSRAPHGPAPYDSPI